MTRLNKENESLQQSERRFRSLFETAAEAIVIVKLSADGRTNFVDGNCRAMEMFECTREELINKGPEDFSPPIQPDGRATHERILEVAGAAMDGKPQSFEWTHCRLDGTTFPVEVTLNRVEIENETYIQAFVRDITERRRADEALRQSEERLRLAVEGGELGFWDFYVESGEGFFDEMWHSMLGYDVGDIEQNVEQWEKLLHPDDKPQILKTLNEHFENPNVVYEVEMRLKTKSGEYRWILAKGEVLVRDDAGKPLRMLGTHLDITERKEAEEALMESESRFRELVENIREVFWMENAEGTELLYVSPAFEQIWGRSCQSFYHNPQEWSNAIHPDDHRRVVDAFDKFRETGVYSEEFRILRPDGSMRWILDRGVPIHDESGQVHRVAGVAEDITEKKEAEIALRQSEVTARALLNATTDAVLLIDKEGLIIDANDKMGERLGQAREDLIGTIIYDHLPAEIAEQRKKKGFEAARTRRPLSFEDQRGSRWFENNVYPILDPQGEAVRFAIYSTDITERKEAEETLKASEERLKILFESAPDGIYLIDMEGRFVDGNRAAEVLTGFNREELIGKNFAEAGLLSEEHLPGAMGNLKEIAYGRPTGPDEFDLQRSDGTTVAVEIRTFPIKIENQLLALGIARDITERKQAEDALKESEAKLRSIIENMPIAYFTFDRQGRFLSWNRAAEQVYGYTKQEAIGASAYDLIVTPTTKEATEEVIQGTFDGKTFEKSEWQDRDKNGEIGWRFGNSFPLLKADGSVDFGVNMNIDITERKQAEKRLQNYQAKLKSLASELLLAEERERRRIAAGIHDDMAQKLAMTKLKLQLLREAVTDEGVADSLESQCESIDEIITSARELTFNLGSPVLYQIGLEAAVESWLEQEIRDKHGLKYELISDESHLKFDDDTKITLYRAVKELVANVVKYADAGRVTVSIRKFDDTVRVSVADDGVGFDVSKLDSSFSPKGGFGLFNIRERLEYLGGTMDINSGHGEGTRVTMVVPFGQNVTAGQNEAIK